MVRLGAILIATACPLLAEWLPIGPFGGPLQTVTTDPHHANVVIAASSTATLYLSRDAGASWTLLPFPAESRAALHALVFDSIRPWTIFAALTSDVSEYAGLYRSSDSGTTWQQLPAMRGQQVWSLAVSPQGEIAAGTESGLYLSQDAGDSWRLISADGGERIRPVVSLAFDSNQPGALYVGTPHLAWKTAGRGAKWTAIHNGMPDDSDIFSIAVDQLTPGRIFASACSGLYVSPNGGAAWSRVPVPDGISSRTYFVAPHPSIRGHIYAGTASGVIWSTDGGAHWRTIASGIARAIAFDTLNLGRIYVATDAGMLRSDDGGIHVTNANQGLSARRLSRLTESEGTLYAGSAESTTPPQLIVAGDRAATAGAYALAGGALLRSSDFGRMWIRLPVPEPTSAILVLRRDVLLIACGAAILRTPDGGRTWVYLETPPLRSPIREIVALDGPAVGVFTDREVIWSPDGIRWIPCEPLPGEPQIHGLAGNGSGVLLAATSAGLIRSSDFGQSWKAAAGELGAISVQAVARDPAASRTFVAAAFGVVYASTDGGFSWRRLSVGGSSIGAIRQLLVSADPQRLFALTEEHGAFVWTSGINLQ